MNVASISTAWNGEVLPTADRRIQRHTYPDNSGPQLARGEYMGHFNMGSTVVILGPQSVVDWSANLRTGRTIRVGEAMARMAKAGE